MRTPASQWRADPLTAKRPKAHVLLRERPTRRGYTRGVRVSWADSVEGGLLVVQADREESRFPTVNGVRGPTRAGGTPEFARQGSEGAMKRTVPQRVRTILGVGMFFIDQCGLGRCARYQTMTR